MPKLTIDGRDIEVEAGTTVIRAADRLGIYVPHYCWHPGLTVAGNCRMCLVEIEKMPKLTTACSTAAADGMVVRTTGPKVKEAQDAIMEFLLINHPLDCPICDQAGECRLQEYAFGYGPARSRFLEEKVHKPKNVDIGEHIVFDAERCILCTRCVRFCQEVSQTHELTVSYRGDHATIETYPGQRLDNAYSGNTVDICPVGALTLKEFRFRQRVWFLKDVKSVCAGCARGCNVLTGISKGRILRITPRENMEVNRWWICDEGRLSYEKLDGPGRIRWARLRGQHAMLQDLPEGEFAAALPRERRDEAAGRAVSGTSLEAEGGALLGAEDAAEIAESLKALSETREPAPVVRGREGILPPGDLLDEPPEEALPRIPVLNEGVPPAPRPLATKGPGEAVIAVALDAAARALAEALSSGGPGSIEFLFSARMTNEDLFALGKLARDQLGASLVALPSHERGEDDRLLIRKDRTPNRTGARAILEGLGLAVEAGPNVLVRVGGGAARAVVAVGPNLMGLETAAADGREEPRGGHDASAPAVTAALDAESPSRLAGASERDRHSEPRERDVAGSAGQVRGASAPQDSARRSSDATFFEALASAAEGAGATLIVIDAFESPLSVGASIVLPALTYGEIEGTVTNFEGRVQRVRAGLAPAADGLPVFRIAQEIGRRLGGPPARGGAQETFSALAAEVPTFHGLGYARLGELGARMPGVESERVSER